MQNPIFIRGLRYVNVVLFYYIAGATHKPQMDCELCRCRNWKCVDILGCAVSEGGYGTCCIATPTTGGRCCPHPDGGRRQARAQAFVPALISRLRTFAWCAPNTASWHAQLGITNERKLACVSASAVGARVRRVIVDVCLSAHVNNKFSARTVQ